MINLLEDLYAPVMHAPTIEDFKVELIKFGKKLGFDLVVADWRGPPLSRSAISINKYSRAWLESQLAMSDEEFAGEPVIKQASLSTRPILWDAETYRKVVVPRLVQARLWTRRANVVRTLLPHHLREKS